ncbi:MAG: acyl-CoA thioesterase domain-containing protein, partial [Ilumatobacteraceae bacterium]
MNDQAEALFEESGDRLAPTELAAGPWDPANCHGGPPSALLARAVERHDDEGVEWQVARLTIELLR